MARKRALLKIKPPNKSSKIILKSRTIYNEHVDSMHFDKKRIIWDGPNLFFVISGHEYFKMTHSTLSSSWFVHGVHTNIMFTAVRATLYGITTILWFRHRRRWLQPPRKRVVVGAIWGRLESGQSFVPNHLDQSQRVHLWRRETFLFQSTRWVLGRSEALGRGSGAQHFSAPNAVVPGSTREMRN